MNLKSLASIAGNSFDEKSGVYPNSSDEIYHLEMPGMKEIIVSDEVGKLVFKEKVNSEEYDLDLRENKKGIYFLTIITNVEKHMIKVQKN